MCTRVHNKITRGDNALFKIYSLARKNPSTKHEKSPFEISVRGIQRTPKTIQAIAIALGSLPESEGKTLY